MGGPGSTRWKHITTKRVVEATRHIDANVLRAQGLLPQAASVTGQGTWFRCHCDTRDPDQAVLQIQYTNDHARCEIITLTNTQPHYGGIRWWFICPMCQRRVRCLYDGTTTLQCRTCGKLAYTSENRSNKTVYALARGTTPPVLNTARQLHQWHRALRIRAQRLHRTLRKDLRTRRNRRPGHPTRTETQIRALLTWLD